MTNPAPERFKGVSLIDFAKGWFELLTRPAVAKACKEIADKEGTTIEALMCEGLVDIYRKYDKPLPPEIREYIANNSDIPESKRKSLLQADLH